MHPPLTDKKNEVCKEFIRALVQCHESYYWLRYLGVCNDYKQALNMCFRRERLERSARNRISAKEQSRRWEEAWEKLQSGDVPEVMERRE